MGRRKKKHTHLGGGAGGGLLDPVLPGKHGAKSVLATQPSRAAAAAAIAAGKGGGAAKAAAAGANEDAEAAASKVPRSIVVRHGRAGRHVNQLVEDLRKVMMPFTALKLKERKNASIKDYTAVAGPMSVSHLMIVQQGARAPNLRVARLPIGPTVSFRVQAYALNRQIRTAQKKAFDVTAALQDPPLVVLNNFEDAVLSNKRHLKIASLTFQSLFPSINVRTVKLANCKRVLLLHLNEEEETIEFRHFLVRTRAAGASRVVKRVLNAGVPNLGGAEDISEILAMRSSASGYATSDSEFDDDAKVAFDSKQGRGPRLENATAKAKVARARQASAGALNQSVVQLYEVGPRMTLQVYKVEEGICTGEVQYHAFEEKTKEEARQLRRAHKEKNELRRQRREQQEENVKRKREAEKEKADKKKLKRQRLQSGFKGDGDDEHADDGDSVASDERANLASPADDHDDQDQEDGPLEGEEQQGSDEDEEDEDEDEDE